MKETATTQEFNKNTSHSLSSQLPVLELESVGKKFSHRGFNHEVLKDVNISVRGGEFVSILGASGCGKSTLLKLIANLETITSGSVVVPSDGVAFMFQDPNLFPWLSAKKNIELALRLDGVAASERSKRAEDLLSLVHLTHVGDKRPHQLSGGMKQRVSLARSLAQNKYLLLMDEPFAALDAITRDILHDELMRIWRETNRAILFVTHNVQEAVRLSQRVVLLSSRPGTILREWDLSADTRSSLSEADLVEEITSVLKREISRHV